VQHGAMVEESLRAVEGAQRTFLTITLKQMEAYAALEKSASEEERGGAAHLRTCFW